MVLNKVWISNSQFIALLKDFHTTFKIIIVQKKEFKSNWSEHFFISPTDLLSIFGFLPIKSFFYS